MKSIYSFLLSSALLVPFVACNKENPFEGESKNGTGRILTSSISVDVKSEVLTTRDASLPEPEDFTIAFCKKETPSEPLYSYSYSELPEVVTLPVGEYYVKAYYGDDNIVAAFDSPCYYGESEILKIENGKVLDVTVPITCTLYNVRVAINFDESLLSVMGEDGKVSVKVGDSGVLDFTPNTTSDGFFQYVEDSNTLAATFTGTVEGSFITESKTYDNVKRGTYYKITFKLHNVETGATDPGSVDSGTLKIDATVTFHDHSSDGGMNVDPDSEEYLEDDRYPNLNPGDDNPGDDKPGQGDNEPEKNLLPSLISDDVDVNVRTDISNWGEGQSLAVKIITPTKLSKFVCTINSSTLTPKELEDVGLKADLDLINDTDLFEDLGQMGFPVGEDVTNPKTVDENGNYVIVFDITQFVKMLNALGDGTHDFIFNLRNEAGENTLTLKLKS